jgi:putative oxidoreductase
MPVFGDSDSVAYTLRSASRPFLQRLFSMFPNGWPGRGLLLLRLVAGFHLMHDGIAGLMAAPQREILAQHSIALAAGMLLLVGLWTPIAGMLVTAVELWIALSGTDNLWNSIVLAASGAALAMLGPGVWSIDARLFGRKRIDIRDR